MLVGSTSKSGKMMLYDEIVLSIESMEISHSPVKAWNKKAVACAMPMSVNKNMSGEQSVESDIGLSDFGHGAHRISVLSQ